MRRLILHIGLMKTGTTAVQALFAGTGGGDLTRTTPGAHWSRTFRGPNHLELPLAFATDELRLRRTVRAGTPGAQGRLRRRIRDGLSRELDAHDTVIVSSEQLPRLRLPGELAELDAFLGALAERVDVVAAIRRADYWLPSSYAEAVTNGRTMRLDAEFVEWRRDLLDHQQLAHRWATAFGADRLRLVPYLESDKSDPSALVRRLLRGMQLEPAADLALPAPQLRTALAAEATEALRLLLPRLPPGGIRPGRARQRVIAALAERLPGPPPALTPSARDALQRANLLDTGIGDTGYAVGDGWAHWCHQPAAEVREAPTIDADALAALQAELTRDGVVRRRAGRLSGRARQVALRTAARRLAGRAFDR